MTAFFSVFFIREQVYCVFLSSAAESFEAFCIEFRK